MEIFVASYGHRLKWQTCLNQLCNYITGLQKGATGSPMDQLEASSVRREEDELPPDPEGHHQHVG